jgi:hypothetical protein
MLSQCPSRPALCILLALLSFSPALRATNVLSYHYDQQNTGQDLTETTLTPANVVPGSFMKRWVRLTDGYIYAQPLYMEGVNIATGPHQGVHNTVFVATEHDSLYAIDAPTGQLLWHRSLLTRGLPGAILITSVPSKDTETTDLVPQIGITGTPVIDGSSGFLYVAAKTKQVLSSDPARPRWVYTLFKISIQDGGILSSNIFAATYIGGKGYVYRTNDDPSVSQDPFVPGSGDGNITVNNQSRVYFNALRQMNRPGALLYNGSLYLAFASHGDNYPFHGWLLSFDAGTLTLNGVFNTTPNGGDGGIWQAGGIPAVDEEGYFYMLTGNGSFDGYGGVTGLDVNGFPVRGDYGDCFLKLALDPTTTQANQNTNGWGFKVIDYFAPMDNQTLAQNDTDLGSGGLMILPDSAGSEAHPHLVIGAGKEGKVYLVDRDNMGKYSPYADNVVQSQANAFNGAGSFSSPAYFNGNFYWAGAGNNAQIFSISNASFSGTAISESSDGFSWPGGTPTITADGTNNALMWVIDRGSNQLRVYDAQDLTQEYWNSDMEQSRDNLGPVVKFTTPTVADGLVFVGTTRGVYAYGGAPPPPSPPSAPTNLAALALSSTDVALTWVIHGTNQAGYVIEDSTDGEAYNQVATLGATAAAADITSLTPSTFYTFRVRAYNAHDTLSYSDYSNTAEATTVAEPRNLDFSGGFAGSTSQLNYAGSATLASGSIAQLTGGGNGETGSVWSQLVQNIQRFDTTFTFQLFPDGDGFADGFTFCIQDVSNIKLAGGGGDLGYAGIQKSIAIKFDIYPNLSTTGLYKDGAHPNDDAPPAISVTPEGLDFHSGDIFSVNLIYLSGVLTETITDTVTGAVFTHKYTVSIPTELGSDTGYVGFTGASGGQTAIQQIQTWSFETLPDSVPKAPTDLIATPASNTEIDIAWKNNATDQTAYLVGRRPDSSSDWSYIAVLPANSLTYNDTSLNPDTHYSYIVRAANAVGYSTASNVANAITPTVPGPLDVMQATSVTAAQVTLEWAGGTQNAQNFILSRQEAGFGRHTVLATLPAGAHAYVDNSVSPGAHYIYRVQASNLAGPSKSIDVNVTIPSH